MRYSRCEPGDAIAQLRQVIVDQRDLAAWIFPVAIAWDPVGGVLGEHLRPFGVTPIVQQTRLAIEDVFRFSAAEYRHRAALRPFGRCAWVSSAAPERLRTSAPSICDRRHAAGFHR